MDLDFVLAADCIKIGKKVAMQQRGTLTRSTPSVEDSKNMCVVVIVFSLHNGDKSRRVKVVIAANSLFSGIVMPILEVQSLMMLVLMLAVRDLWSDKVCGVDAVVGDYVVKSFHLEEVLVRLCALIRRSMGHATNMFFVGRFY
ncbi:hypothetical protein BAR153v2_009850 [Bartonella sp. AR 15-3]|nr:hypothetical protein BAR153v2_009850 [Bartonella sp. AR 15-3]CBI78934.1 hypothetical protein BAR15_110130 [Bartonella sp. AR 15-3]